MSVASLDTAVLRIGWRTLFNQRRSLDDDVRTMFEGYDQGFPPPALVTTMYGVVDIISTRRVFSGPRRIDRTAQPSVTPSIET